MSHVMLYPVALALVIGGCAGPMGPIRGNSPPTPPVTAFDGSFRTPIHSVSSFGAAQTTAWCESPGQPTITVAEGRFTYGVPHPNVPGNATPIYPATMAEDGSFHGEIVSGTISGQIRGNHIEGRIDGSACIYTFAGDRV